MRLGNGAVDRSARRLPVYTIHIPAITITVTQREPEIPPTIPPDIPPGDLLSAFEKLGHEALDIAQVTPPERLRERVPVFLLSVFRALCGHSDGVPDVITDESSPTGRKGGGSNGRRH